MQIFRDIDLVEQLGSRVPRILQSYGQESFYFSENFTRMSFPMDEGAKQNTEVLNVTENVTKNKLKTSIGFMQSNRHSTTEEIAKKIEIHIYSVLNLYLYV